jgi:hypothetical protein
MTKCFAPFEGGLCELELGHVGMHDATDYGPRCKATWKGESCAYERGHSGKHWTITKDGEETWATCSDCGACNVEAWSPYARYCYRCGSKACADVDAAWMEAGHSLETELVLFAIQHRDGGDLAPRALQWLQAQKGRS